MYDINEESVEYCEPAESVRETCFRDRANYLDISLQVKLANRPAGRYTAMVHSLCMRSTGKTTRYTVRMFVCLQNCFSTIRRCTSMWSRSSSIFSLMSTRRYEYECFSLTRYHNSFATRFLLENCNALPCIKFVYS